MKSVYEKEPLFKDFVRNIPLSEMNFYENRNLTTLKKRFDHLVQAKHGDDLKSDHDPLRPLGVRTFQGDIYSHDYSFFLCCFSISKVF